MRAVRPQPHTPVGAARRKHVRRGREVERIDCAGMRAAHMAAIADDAGRVRPKDKGALAVGRRHDVSQW